MVKNKRKRLLALLLGMTMLMSMAVNVVAGDSYDVDKKGSVTVTLNDNSDSHKPVRGVELTLYQVADVSTDNTEGYVLTEEFEKSGADLSNLNAEGLAEHLTLYAAENKIDGIMKTTDENGTVIYNDLNVGLYLVAQTNEVEHYEMINSFLVTVPMADKDGTGWVYDVNASPKTEIIPEPEKPEEYTSIEVEKVWEDDGTSPKEVTVELLGNGKVVDTVKLNDSNNWKYNWTELNKNIKWSVVETNIPEDYTVTYKKTENKVIITNTKVPEVVTDRITVKKVWESKKDHPKSVEVELRQGNKVYDKVVLNSKNNWSYTWKDLSENKSWKVYEVNVPEGYKVKYTVKGYDIIITNSKPEKVKPPLIQTGQLNWPVPLLLFTGIVLIILGYLIGKRNEK